MVANLKLFFVGMSYLRGLGGLVSYSAVHGVM